MTTVWIVVRYWPGGRRESVAAFFNEENARFRAGQEAGGDTMIALERIEVSGGLPVENSDQ